jgi:hypothetical protein
VLRRGRNEKRKSRKEGTIKENTGNKRKKKDSCQKI